MSRIFNTVAVLCLCFNSQAAFMEWKTSEGGNGHLYEAVYTPAGITWSNAKAQAEAAGGYLATIASPAENAFVFNLVADPKFWCRYTDFSTWITWGAGPWLGGYEPLADNHWAWVNGEPFDYTHWDPFLPDNSAMSQHWLHFGNRFGDIRSAWDDAGQLDKFYGYIIEKSGNPIIAVSPASLSFVDVPAVLGTPQTKMLTVKNTGSAPLSIGPIALSGPNALEFAWLFPTSTPLAPGEERDLEVSFLWPSWAKKTASLSIAHNAQDPNPVLIPLEGGGADIQPTELKIVPEGVRFTYHIVGGNLGVPAAVELYWADKDFPAEAEDIPADVNVVLAHRQTLRSAAEGSHEEVFVQNDFTGAKIPPSPDLLYLGCKIVVDDIYKKNNLLAQRMTITAPQMRSYLAWHNRQRSAGHPEAGDFRDVTSLQWLIDSSLANGWDPRFILGIACAESIFGSNDEPPYPPLPGTCNYWGLKEENGGFLTWMSFASWTEAVAEAASRPADPTYLGRTKVSQFAQIYAPTAPAEWNDTVFGVMKNLGYPSTDDAATSAAGFAYCFNPGSGSFRAYSPVSLYLRDPAGRRVGRLSAGDDVLNEIPQATLEMTGGRILGIRLPSFVTGTYVLQVTGTGAGSYQLESIITDRLGRFGGEIITWPIEQNGLHIYAIEVVADNAESTVVVRTYADSDGDGIPDERDAFPLSDMRPTLIIADQDTGVRNQVLPDGATFSDRIAMVFASAKNHGAFVSAVADLANPWMKAGLIGGRDKGKIQSAAARASLPQL